MWELEKSLQKKLDNLIKIELSVYNIYSNLCQLEKEGKKGSPKFQQYVDYLILTLEIEKEKYKKITRNEEEMNLILYYLEEKYHLFGADAYHDFVYLDNEAKVATRIMETIETVLDDICDYDNDYESDYNNDYDNEYDSDYDEPIESLKMYNILKKKNHYHNLKKMAHQMETPNNFENVTISNEHVKSLKELYFDYKYNMAFVDKEIETSFIMNDFNAKDLLILKSWQQAEFLNIPFSDYRTEDYYNTVNEVFEKVSTYCDYSGTDLLLSFNVEKRMLSLWYLINTFKSMNYRQLEEIEKVVSDVSYFSNLNENDKETILSCINSSMNAILEKKKNDDNEGKRTYKKKK